MKSRKKYKLGEIIDSISIKHKFPSNKIIFLNTSDVLEGRVINHNYSEVNTLPGQAKKSIQKNDILYSEIRPKNKRFAYVDFNAEDYVVSTKLMVLRVKEISEVLPRYLYYYLTSESIIDYLQMVAESRSGTFPQITFSELKNIEIELPKIEEQKIVSKFLDNIEDKLENNKNIISNLEQLAQTVFKHWFIDFDFPKENGEPYLSSGGKMHESELGLIPERWTIGTLSDLGNIVAGGTPSKKREDFYTKQGIPWITPKDLSADKSVFISKGAIDITKEGLTKSSAKILPKNSVLFSSRAPIGYIAISACDVSTNQGFKSIVPNENIPFEFIYFLLKKLTPVIESNAGGSTFKEISGSGMKAIKVVIPPDKLLNEYKNVVDPMFKKIKEIEKEINLLNTAKETLLPKLLSGEIELSKESEEINYV